MATDGQGIGKNPTGLPEASTDVTNPVPKKLDGQPPSLPEILRSKLDGEDRSGASTPSFVRTAAEVADSAALLDKEPAEPEISAAEAGKIGYRRLTSTPIPEVANTAAEVADTAETLDKTHLMEHADTHPGKGALSDREQPRSPLDDEEFRAPLFAHECFENDGGERADADEAAHGEFQPENDDGGLLEPIEIDINDPTLERFPSNRDEIMDTVRRVESSLNEDPTICEGVPPSPVVGQSKDVDEAYGLALASSPWSSPVTPRGAKRLDVPRLSSGSVGSDKAPLFSLGAIDESEEKSVGADQTTSTQRPAGSAHESADAQTTTDGS